jgi:hypothetical protein
VAVQCKTFVAANWTTLQDLVNAFLSTLAPQLVLDVRLDFRSSSGWVVFRED